MSDEDKELLGAGLLLNVAFWLDDFVSEGGFSPLVFEFLFSVHMIDVAIYFNFNR